MPACLCVCVRVLKISNLRVSPQRDFHGIPACFALKLAAYCRAFRYSIAPQKPTDWNISFITAVGVLIWVNLKFHSILFVSLTSWFLHGVSSVSSEYVNTHISIPVLNLILVLFILRTWRLHTHVPAFMTIAVSRFLIVCCRRVLIFWWRRCIIPALIVRYLKSGRWTQSHYYSISI